MAGIGLIHKAMNFNSFRRNEIIRNIAIPVYRSVSRFVVHKDFPKMSIISIPKAGTHLVSKVLNEVPGFIFCGFHLSEEQIFTEYPCVPGETDIRLEVSDVLSQCREGQYITLHAPFDKRINHLLDDVGYRKIFIKRDPRDVVVSYVNYVLREKRHFHHDYFQHIGDFDKLLRLTITGFEKNQYTSMGLPSIADMLVNYRGWRDDESVTEIKFEDLVGVRGGGSRSRQLGAVSKVLSAANVGNKGALLDRISGRIYSNKSVTFSKGSVQQWRHAFNKNNLNLFNEAAAKETAALGYLL